MKIYNILNNKWLFFLTLFLLVMAAPVFADDKIGHGISWFLIAMGLVGGLVFFLLGIELMENGMKKSAGGRMRELLADLTRNPVRGLFAGIFVTMVIQSSNAAIVMLVSFVESGLMRFAQTLSIILGAGIGATMNAQLIAFNLGDYALALIAVGYAARLFAKNDRYKNYGEAALGFGLLFYGMRIMAETMSPLKTYEPIVGFLNGLDDPFVGFVAGAFVSAVIQSSNAFTGILMIMASQGLVGLEASIPLIIGSNLGKCITAFFAGIGGSREGKRVAATYFFFKLVGALIFLPFVPQFSEFIRWIASLFGSDLSRQIANVHTFFNIGIGVLFIPFTELLARLMIRIFPAIEEPGDAKMYVSFLDESKIVAPSTAIDLARVEISRMAATLEKMIKASAVPFAVNEEKKDKEYPHLSLVDGIEMRRKEVDYLEDVISDYLIKMAKQTLSESESKNVYAMISIVKDMESVANLISRNVIPLIPKKKALEKDFSPEGREELLIYHQKMCKQIRLLKEAFSERDYEKAGIIMAKERKYLSLESQYRIKHLDRIMNNRIESRETHEVHMELMNLMTQIIVYTSNIAKTFLGATDKH
ncbi:Na/Pi cotransporter family protein [Desulforegula conservatrix]|uniref:Na/Pi cotransporter family protein n=1 Tax=Desulforegula conservatrix TaxID=153026 RepID=UPI0003F9AF20|nr:Na/Pi cotransporter family protein [Desulforegula conservatrix]